MCMYVYVRVVRVCTCVHGNHTWPALPMPNYDSVVVYHVLHKYICIYAVCYFRPVQRPNTHLHTCTPAHPAHLHTCTPCTPANVPAKSLARRSLLTVKVLKKEAEVVAVKEPADAVP